MSIFSKVKMNYRDSARKATKKIKFYRYWLTNSILRYYLKSKNQKHIFIYSVCGRAGSTALLRIINSSNEVCLYGEPHYTVDKILAAINLLEWWNGKKSDQLDNLVKSFKKGSHDLWIANATPSLDLSILLMSSVIADIFKPINSAKRFGYKEIRLVDENTLFSLRKIFPNCIFIFLFRDPLKQWPSIKGYMPNEYNDGDLQYFLDEYVRLSNCYMEFSKLKSSAFFIEDVSLNDVNALNSLMSGVDISRYNPDLLKRRVRGASNFEKHVLSGEEKNIIISSAAYENYKLLKERTN